MTKALYPGTFDPLTLGHVNIVARAAGIFSSLTVGVSADTLKNTLFSFDKRVALARQAVADLDFSNVTVEGYDGLTTAYARAIDAEVIIRGVRNASDFDAEMQLLHGFRSLDSKIETLLMIADPGISFLSSSMIKQVAGLEGDVSSFVPSCVAQALTRLKK